MSLVIAGLDEVGIGALAGPFVAVVAVFRDKDLAMLPPGVRDSKKTTEEQRGMLFEPLIKAAWDVGLGHAWPWEIDRMGPSAALQLTYHRALRELRVPYDQLVIDGNVGVKNFTTLFHPASVKVEPKADVNYLQVSAASIIAKWIRDEMMISYHRKFPFYDWDKNKGYGTAAHEEAIRKRGLVLSDFNSQTYIHRKHYCKKFL